MRIDQLLQKAIDQDIKSIALMVDFVLNDRQWVKPHHSESALQKYLFQGHIQLMAEMVIEYKYSRKGDPNWILYDMFREEVNVK